MALSVGRMLALILQKHTRSLRIHTRYLLRQGHACEFCWFFSVEFQVNDDEKEREGILMRRDLWLVIVAVGYLVATSPGMATTEATTIFCQKYDAAEACANEAVSCNMCHAGPPSLNEYGLDLKENTNGDFNANLYEALDKVKDLDSDGDGATNEEEIKFAGHPGNKEIRPSMDVQVSYDRELAFRRMKTVFCGAPVTYAEVQALNSAADPKAFMHTELDKCLASDYWTGEALHRIADKRIQPLSTIGFGGNVVIGDYRFDYRLFSYVMSGDRDVRELLSADYHIDENGNKIEGAVAREEGFQLGERIVIAGGQPLDPARRAGMITTQWFISNNTMFAPLPRNSASQAYRGYLGLDLAKGEGIIPVANEPRDVDNKNIAQPDCAVCHSTLDPLAYSFASYNGIEVSIALLFGNPIGTYDAGRTPWGGDGVIFGQPVNDLLEWAEIARNSDAFKKNTVHMIFDHALSREPLPHEADEYNKLWEGLATEDGYSVNKMIHRFVETGAFGGRIQ